MEGNNFMEPNASPDFPLSANRDSLDIPAEQIVVASGFAKGRGHRVSESLRTDSDPRPWDNVF